MEHIKGNCPRCGKPLEIPADLEKFSCLYCGARTTLKEMLEMQNLPKGQYGAEREYLKEHLPKTVINYPEYYKKMNRKDFIPTFEAYEAENTPIVKRLDVCVRSAPEGREACIEALCSELLDAIEAHLKVQPKWAKKSDDLLFSTRVVLALFLTPLIRKLRLQTAESFCWQLNQQWIKRWPKHKWTPGEYSVLEAGYKKRGLCFITTATCLHEGKADDCAELTAFRAFRDGYLMENGCQSQVDLYYHIAPTIVNCINYCDDPDRCYAEIRQNWLEPCYRAIREDRPQECHRLYCEMVEHLRNKYLQ